MVGQIEWQFFNVERASIRSLVSLEDEMSRGLGNMRC